jgi:uncharacterized membrane protein YgaE (UPF0421/DUF939 family)
MNRVKIFLANLAIVAITFTLNVIGFGLIKIIKFVGLDPDGSAYQKYVKAPGRKISSERPSFNFKKTSNLKNQDIENLKSLNKQFIKNKNLEEYRHNLKDLVAKIQKASEEAP